jgi:hypothetical protein
MSENTPAQAETNTQTGVSNETQNKTVDVAALDERAYHELIQTLDPKAIEAKQAEPVAKEAPQPETPAEQPAEAAEAQEPAKAEEAEKTEEKEQEEPKADETAETDPENLPERIRIGSWSEVERKALQIRARNPDLSLEQAMEMAKGKDQAEPAQQLPNLTEIENQLDAKATQKAEAIKALEFDKAAQLELEIAKLQKEFRKAEKLAERQEEAEKVARQESMNSAKQKAVDFYPDTASKDSALTKKMYEIFDVLQDTGNPLISDPNMPFKLAQMAANELGIAPRNPKAPKASPAPAPAKAPAPSPSAARRSPTIQPASGNARTNTPQQPTASDVLSKIEDVDQFRELMAKL